MHAADVERSALRSFVTFVTLLLVVFILRVAEDVVVPLAMSVLLAFLLSPLVNRLARWGLPDALAVTATGALAFAALGGLGWVVGSQAVAVMEELPRHEANIRAKLNSMQVFAPGGSLSRTTGLVNELTEEAEEIAEAAEPEKKQRERGDPVPVVVTGSRESQFETIRRLLMPALSPLGTAGIVVIFVLVILFQRHDLRDRFINLISAGQVNVATQAVDDAARRVSRYLGMQLLVNLTYGIPVGIGLYFIGIPGALLWGMLATVLRFIPFLGPWIAAAFPLVLAAAIDPGWTMLLYTAGLFIVLELISNNVIEVVVYGSSTGISSFALLVAAVFWTWLWGTAGLFMSTPLTACVLVMGKYVPGLKFLSVVLGSAPSSTVPSLFFQRMLSMNFEGMHTLARQYIKERSIEVFYDEVFVPALIMAEEERHRGALAEIRQRFIVQAGADLVEELANDPETCTPTETPPAPRGAEALGVVILPAGDEADEVAGLMLQHVLACRGWQVEITPLTMPRGEWAAGLREGQTHVAVISAVPPSAVTAARKLGRRLRGERANVHVLVGIWNPDTPATELAPRLRAARPDGVVNSIAEAATYLERFANPDGDPRTDDAPVLAGALAPSAAPHGWDPAEAFDLIRRELAAAFGVPISLVKLVDVDRAYWSTMTWLSDENDALRDALRDTPLAATMEEKDVIDVPAVRKDRRLAGNTVLEERGVQCLACASLRSRDGRIVGLLCVVDTRMRTLTGEHLQQLSRRSADLMAAVERSPQPDSVPRSG